MKTLLQLSSLTCLFLFVACSQTVTVSTDLDADSLDPVQTAIQEVDSGAAILIDVREQSEWDAKRLNKAVLVPKSKLDEDLTCIEEVDGVDKTIKIYTHCARGARATTIADALKEKGYNAIPLKVAFDELVDQGFQLFDESLEPSE